VLIRGRKVFRLRVVFTYGKTSRSAGFSENIMPVLA
jgi:hypothetical protein